MTAEDFKRSLATLSVIEKIEEEAKLNLRKVNYTDLRVSRMTFDERKQYDARKEFETKCGEIIESDIKSILDKMEKSKKIRQKDIFNLYVEEKTSRLKEATSEIELRRDWIQKNEVDKHLWQGESVEMATVRINFECRDKLVSKELWEEEKKVCKKYLDYLEDLISREN